MSDSGITIGGKWLDDLNEELTGSDRSCAILAAAVLDERLATLLRARFCPPVGKEDKLLGRGGAIESFSSRIEVGYRIGLLSESIRKALDWLRDIRNDAAHRTEFTFSADAVRARVENVVVALELRSRCPRMLQGPYDSPKGHFVAAAVTLTCMLEAAATEDLRLSAQPPVDMARMHFPASEATDGAEG